MNNKRRRDTKHKNHLKKLAKNYFGCYYYKEVYRKDKGFIQIPKPYYKRFYRRRASKYLKKLSNRRVRYYKEEMPFGCFYHKLYDYWWELE